VSKIETGRYSERLRRALGMKGVEVVAGELSPEISPVFILEDNSIEWKFLQQVRVCGSAIIQNGAAGNETLVRWQNPVASGIMAVFSHLDYTASLDENFNFGFTVTTAGLATPGVTAVFDHRWDTGLNPTAVKVTRTSAGATIALGGSVFVTRVAINNRYPWDGAVVVLPGEGLEFGSPGTFAVNIRVNARWTERHLPALEE